MSLSLRSRLKVENDLFALSIARNGRIAGRLANMLSKIHKAFRFAQGCQFNNIPAASNFARAYR